MTYLGLLMVVLCVILGFMFAFRWGWFEVGPLIGWVCFGIVYLGVTVAFDCVVLDRSLKYCESYTPPEHVEMSIEAIDKAKSYNKMVDSTQRIANNPIVSRLASKNRERASKLTKVSIEEYGYYIPTVEEWKNVEGSANDSKETDVPEEELPLLEVTK